MKIFCILILNIFFYQNVHSIQNENTENIDLFRSSMVTPNPQQNLQPKQDNKKLFHTHVSHNNVGHNTIKNNKISFNKFKLILVESSFPETSVKKMWCIAKNESAFNPLAYNYNKNGTFDVGIFQINQIWKRWCKMTDKDLLDVKNNSICALKVLRKQGYFAWTTYNKFCR